MSAIYQKEHSQTDDQHVVDYKMVTFTLGGKDYGIDIMDVKEISKAERLTPVPNTAPYVRGVINLRGEIISTIDLRRMLKLPDPDTETGEAEDVIFVNVEDHLIGIIVDLINDVIGIDSSTIQPPHPIFGDINLMYIEGVVEYQNKLYIILDTGAIFGSETTFGREPSGPQTPLLKPVESGTVESIPDDVEELSTEPEALSYSFITETLLTFKSFVVSEINEGWVRARFDTWKEERGPNTAALQLKSHEDAEKFLSGFYSVDEGAFWTKEYAEAFTGILKDNNASSILVWDIGCGEGRGAFSAASALKVRFPDKQIKIWAQDGDLIKVSSAPNMVFKKSDIPQWMLPFTSEGSRGFSFAPELSDSVIFEYHDILNGTQLPEVNVIIAKDILSFLGPNERAGLLNDFAGNLLQGGVLIAGDNERIPIAGWDEHTAAGMSWYTKST